MLSSQDLIENALICCLSDMNKCNTDNDAATTATTNVSASVIVENIPSQVIPELFHIFSTAVNSMRLCTCYPRLYLNSLLLQRLQVNITQSLAMLSSTTTTTSESNIVDKWDKVNPAQLLNIFANCVAVACSDVCFAILNAEIINLKQSSGKIRLCSCWLSADYYITYIYLYSLCCMYFVFHNLFIAGC